VVARKEKKGQLSWGTGLGEIPQGRVESGRREDAQRIFGGEEGVTLVPAGPTHSPYF